ncbi:hypothetical protein ACLKA7_002406 [Drosophila subpalustris]
MAASTTRCGLYWVIFLLISLFSTGQATRPPVSSSLDTRLANQIFSYVNESISPCDDYYKYACGKWGEKHEYDNFMEITGLIDQKVNENIVTLMDELEKRSLRPNTVEAKALRVYQTCRAAKSGTRSSKHYLELVPPNDQISWPQFTIKPQVWASNKFQWMETLGRLRRYGLSNVLFKLEVIPHMENSSKYIINIDSPSFEQKNQRLQSVTLTKLRLQLLGVDRRRARTLASKIKALEASIRHLAETNVSEESSRDLSLRELETLTRGKWRNFLNIVRDRRLSADYELQVDNLDYFPALMQLLENYDREVLASYIMLRFVMFLQEESMDSDEPIACAQEVRGNMELAANLFYETRFIGPDKLRQHQADVQELFGHLRKQFLLKLEGNHLHLKRSQMDMLRLKMNKMTLNIGNMPQNVNRTQFVAQYYENLRLSEEHDYARIQLELLQFRVSRWFEQLEKPVANSCDFFYISDSDTGMSSTPYYMLRQNIIIVPYGILQEPIFHHDAHDIFKVSLLGFMLGHELMHGFVSGGLIFDSQGNGYESGLEIIQQDRFSEGMSCLNRNETDYIEEREADIAGIRLAYDVYFGPGSSFSQTQPSFTSVPLKQFFFLSMAQFFCGQAPLGIFVEHDADEMRLRQVLINFPAFADAYNCRKDLDNMHPSQKCRLW